MNLVLNPVAIDVDTGPLADKFRRQLKAHARGSSLSFEEESIDHVTLFKIAVTDKLLPQVLAKAAAHGAHWRVSDETVRSNARHLIIINTEEVSS